MTCDSLNVGASTNHSQFLPMLAFKGMAGILAFSALALATIHPLPLTYPVSLERTWNENLRGALLTRDVTAYNYAIEMGADVNAPREDGKTPLQIAIAANNLPACKFLLDRGAKPTAEDKMRLERALIKKGVQTHEIYNFFLERPTLHTPQVLMPNGTFVNIASLPVSTRLALFTKPIALFLIQNEGINQYYGGVSKEFDEHAIFSFYERIAPDFTVIRILMNDRDRIVPLMDQIKDFFPGLPLLNMTIHGHGNPNCVELGPNSFLTTEDTAILEHAGLRLDPNATVDVSGCECANGPNNLIQRMSYCMKRIVMGSPQPVGGTIAEIRYPQPNLPTLVSFHSPDMEKFHVHAYKNGIEVVRGDHGNKSVTDNIVAAINGTLWKIKELPIQQIFFGRQNVGQPANKISDEQLYRLRLEEMIANQATPSSSDQ